MGEFDLLARVQERLPPTAARVQLGMGDDAAITVPGGATATSVDAIVEGVHFRRTSSTLTQIGRKALGSALSDLAAMGAEPGEAYVLLGVPPDLSEDGCLELFDGIAALAAETATSLAGGDVTRSAILTVAITVVGHARDAGDFVTRSGAKAGDRVVISGELGGAAAGLLLLERPELAAALPAEIAAALKRRLHEPVPRLAAGRTLAQNGATAMIDISDGLGADAGHLARQSQIALRIDAGSLPLAEGVEAIAAAAGLGPIELAASGGEDYELLATLPPERLREAGAATAVLGTELTTVGEVVAGAGVEIRLPGGRVLEPTGFDQLG